MAHKWRECPIWEITTALLQVGGVLVVFLWLVCVTCGLFELDRVNKELADLRKRHDRIAQALYPSSPGIGLDLDTGNYGYLDAPASEFVSRIEFEEHLKSKR